MTTRGNDTQQDLLCSVWTGLHKRGSSSQHKFSQRLMVSGLAPEGEKGKRNSGVEGDRSGSLCV